MKYGEGFPRRDVIVPSNALVRRVKDMNPITTAETWMERLDAERAEHDLQRRDLQARNTELVERNRELALRLSVVEKVLRGLRPDHTKDGFFLPNEYLLEQEEYVRLYLKAP